ncbi:hypothetical protein ACFYY2_32065 [Streptomyces sp. NPDC001822]|uniref:hypothetical protein n=1 Tax=Streptomyces sp. NPDC001822 TaxID=3364614 RepID=UPI0036A0F5EF
MNSPGDLSGLAVVLDAADDAAHTHRALAAHDLAAGRVTLHPGPGTSGETALGHDLLAALGKPPQLPGRFPGGRQPVWEAATAWMGALPVTRLTVLRAHRLTSRRIERLLHLQETAGIHLTLVLHRPRLTSVLDRVLAHRPHTVAVTLAEACALYYGSPPPPTLPALQAAAAPPTAALPGTAAGPSALAVPGTVAAAGAAAVLQAAAAVRSGPGRWMTLACLDRLVSFDSPSPCPGPCTPGPIHFAQRPAPVALTPAQAAEAARRIHSASSHPQLAAALATALFTGASFQQLTTARPGDFQENPATLALHDRTRFTDGCAAYPVPPWAAVFLRAATRYTHLTHTPHLLAAPGQRPAVLRLAETARLRPPQPPLPGCTRRRSAVVWDWSETRSAGGGPAAVR